MLTLLKKIFTWWNQDTFGTRLKTIFYGKLVGSDELVTNIMKVKMEKDGLFMQILLMHQKYQLNGILGCILHLIKLKKIMNLKNMIGKNLINLI